MEQVIGVFQTVAEGFRLWRKNAGAFSRIYLLLYTPLTLLAIPFALVMQPSAASAPIGAPKVILLVLAIYVLSLWAQIVFILGAAEAQSGNAPRPFKLIKEAGKYFWSLLGTSILYGLVLLTIVLVVVIACAVVGMAMGLANKTLQGSVGLAANIVGIILLVTGAVAGVCYGVYFAIRLSLAWYVCVLENLRPLASLKRSLFLVKKSVNAVVGVWFFTIAATGVLIYTLPVALWNWLLKPPTQQATIINGAWQYLAGILFVPAIVCVSVILLQKLKEVNQ